LNLFDDLTQIGIARKQIALGARHFQFIQGIERHAITHGALQRICQIDDQSRAGRFLDARKVVVVTHCLRTFAFQPPALHQSDASTDIVLWQK
jgi:hypothetical protein